MLDLRQGIQSLHSSIYAYQTSGLVPPRKSAVESCFIEDTKQSQPLEMGHLECSQSSCGSLLLLLALLICSMQLLSSCLQL